ncbi:MAG: hypothetical protein HYV09_29665 [Deltaproteobacteria bacterium]|nr:hypothetical protein [Deltaproteobacteria bacterium]
MARFLTQLVVGLGSGLVGALALTAAHEGLRRSAPDSPRPKSPRLDVLGMRALRSLAEAFGLKKPRGKELRRDALAGDLLANTAWFGLAAGGRHPWVRGISLGLLAGVGALVLPPVLGLGRTPRSSIVRGQTVGLFVLGGLAAAGVAWAIQRASESRMLAQARAAAGDARVNARSSGMIH